MGGVDIFTVITGLLTLLNIALLIGRAGSWVGSRDGTATRLQKDVDDLSRKLTIQKTEHDKDLQILREAMTRLDAEIAVTDDNCRSRIQVLSNESRAADERLSRDMIDRYHRHSDQSTSALASLTESIVQRREYERDVKHSEEFREDVRRRLDALERDRYGRRPHDPRSSNR